MTDRRFVELSHVVHAGMITNTGTYLDAPWHRFTAAPPGVAEFGTFPVRAFATVTA